MYMLPRLKTSGKRQEFPLDYVKMIKDVIAKNFKKATKDKKVIVEGYIYHAEILIRIGFQNQKAITQKNFEASIEYSNKSKNIMEKIYLAIDALCSMIGQYYDAEEEIEMPTAWNEFRLDGTSIYLQTSNENTELEAAADEFLKKTES